MPGTQGPGAEVTAIAPQRQIMMDARTVMFDWSSQVDASCPLPQSVQDAERLP